MDTHSLLRYPIAPAVEAFSTRRDSTLPYPVATGHQVHGTGIAVVDRRDTVREDFMGYDAFVTDLPGLAVAVRTADCIPVLLYAEDRGVVAAVHAGWRGTVARISQKTIRLMQGSFRCDPRFMYAVIGPGIAKESFQVGEEVVGAFGKEGFPMDMIYSFDGPPLPAMRGGHHLDLFAANRFLLEECGLDPGRIQVCGIDTYRDLSLYSARREGISCGRIITSIRLNLP